MKTGKTAAGFYLVDLLPAAAMEPDHEDREDHRVDGSRLKDQHAAMEPDHEDREDGFDQADDKSTARPQWSPIMKTGKTRRTWKTPPKDMRRRNGARS